MNDILNLFLFLSHTNFNTSICKFFLWSLEQEDIRIFGASWTWVFHFEPIDGRKPTIKTQENIFRLLVFSSTSCVRGVTDIAVFGTVIGIQRKNTSGSSVFRPLSIIAGLKLLT